MARITVEQKALSDARYDMLGMRLGCDRHGALGRCLLLWNECQERERYDLPAELISAILGNPDGARMLILSELGEETPGGTIRIKGTEGRIEWLAHARAFGKRGGRPKLQEINHTVNPTVNGTENLRGYEEPNPPSPAPTPTTNTETNPPTPQPRKRGAAGGWFKAPTVLEVQAYLDELGERRFTGEAFVAAYASQGWVKNNGRPVKDWKGCVTTWREVRNKSGEENPAAPAPPVRNIPAEFEAWRDKKYPNIEDQIKRGGFKALKAEFDAECGVGA